MPFEQYMTFMVAERKDGEVESGWEFTCVEASAKWLEIKGRKGQPNTWRWECTYRSDSRMAGCVCIAPSAEWLG